MKHLKHLLTALVFVSLIVFTNCGGGGGGGTDPDPADEQAKKLVATWSLTAEGGKLDSQSISEWNGFTLSFTGDRSGGSYTVSGSQADEVWPSSGGSWEFDGTNIGKIVRSDNVTISISSVTATALTLSFNVSEAAARTSGIYGDWTFTFAI